MTWKYKDIAINKIGLKTDFTEVHMETMNMKVTWTRLLKNGSQ